MNKLKKTLYRKEEYKRLLNVIETLSRKDKYEKGVPIEAIVDESWLQPKVVYKLLREAIKIADVYVPTPLRYKAVP